MNPGSSPGGNAEGNPPGEISEIISADTRKKSLNVSREQSAGQTPLGILEGIPKKIT